MDRTMRAVVGPDWKAVCRVEVPAAQRYVHATEWPRVVAEQREWLEKNGRWEEVKDKFASPHTSQ